MAEMVRVLKVGGKLLLTVPLPTSVIGVMKDHVRNADFLRLLCSFFAIPFFLVILAINLLQEKWHREGVYHFLTTEQVTTMATQLCLEILEVKECFSGTYTLLLARKRPFAGLYQLPSERQEVKPQT